MIRSSARSSKPSGLLGLCLLVSGWACESTKSFELALESDPRRDLAFLLLVDERGNLVREPLRAEQGVALSPLGEDDQGAWVLGFFGDELPSGLNARLDRAAFADARLGVGIPEGPRLAPDVHASADGRSLEFIVSAEAPHFERTGPLDLGTGASSLPFPEGLILRIPQTADFCSDGTLTRIDRDKTPWLDNYPADVRQLEPIFPGQLLMLIQGSVVRYHAATSSVGDHDVLTLPPPRYDVEPRALWTEQVAFFPEVDGKRRVLVAMREQSGGIINTGRLIVAELSRNGSWSSAPRFEHDFGLVGPDGLPEALLGLAISPIGDVLLVGGTELESRYAGFLGLHRAGTPDLRFERVSILVGGSPNGDKFESVAAAPLTDRSLFAVTTGGSEIILLERRPNESELRVVERHRPRSELEGRIRFLKLRFFETSAGLELWAVADKNLLVRRRANGVWEEFGALIERAGVEPQVADCGPFAFPGPLQWNDVARSGRSVLLSRLGCGGLLRIELDEDDDLACVGATPVGGDGLRVTSTQDFNGLLHHEGRWFAGGFRSFSLFEASLE